MHGIVAARRGAAKCAGAGRQRALALRVAVCSGVRMSSARLAAAHAWLPQGWEEAVDIGIVEGRFARVRPGEAQDAAGPAQRWVLPGMVNLHSHAFQRAMAGLAERRSPGAAAREDSFWTWREVM